MGNTVGSQRSLTKQQREILIGTLLGDGCLEKNGRNVRLRIDHGLGQKDYIDWKFRELEHLATDSPRLIKGTMHPNTEKRYERWHFSTFSLPELNTYWYKFYSKRKKRVPKDILKLLKSPLSLAIWFMDDGYKRNDCNAFRISTECFNLNEQKLLQKCLGRNFRIKVNPHRKGKFWNLYIPSAEVRTFSKVVKPYIIPSMNYKISLTP